MKLIFNQILFICLLLLLPNIIIGLLMKLICPLSKKVSTISTAIAQLLQKVSKFQILLNYLISPELSVGTISLYDLHNLG